MQLISTSFCMAIVTLTLCGCMSLKEVRTGEIATLPEMDIATDTKFDCESGREEASHVVAAVEEYKRYSLSFVELDDQGWFHSGRQLKLIDDKLTKELANSNNKDIDFDVIVFVHGWHHNVYDSDCNVNEFRSMLTRAADRYDRFPGARKRRLVGVYIGWRGESVKPKLASYFTVVDRKNTAEHVAKGQIREVFALLRKHEIAANAPDKPGEPPHDRMRSMVMGHSFGGLIAFHGLSQAMVNDLEITRPTVATGCGDAVPSTRPRGLAGSWPDLLVLINPAFEASRFEAIHDVVQRTNSGEAPCPYSESTVPKVVVVTADNDRWTGPAFVLARKIETVFETYSVDSRDLEESEREANLHTIGFDNRYRTHRLCQLGEPPVTMVSFTPSPNAKPEEIQDHGAPVWVVGAGKEIINGHDGFLYAGKTGDKSDPILLNWLLDLHAGIRPNHALATQPGLVAADSMCGEWSK